MASSWEVWMSSSRRMPYFFNTETKESRWDPPPGLSQTQVQALPGADRYLRKSGGGGEGSEPDKVRASHLLVKHRGSRRPASWKDDNITRSKEEAIALLMGYNDEIQGDPNTFARLAAEHSDDSSHAAGGDLGWFGRGKMQKPFEEATYALQPGQMSGIVDTASGVHLILRTG